MAERITFGIKISVETEFEKQVNLKAKTQFVYSYTVNILNMSDSDVQLLKRRWVILNARSEKKIVEGDGVIGKQPIIKPGESYQYSSWCPLDTEVGKMYGHYEMQRLKDDEAIIVEIPEFYFQTNSILN